MDPGVLVLIFDLVAALSMLVETAPLTPDAVVPDARRFAAVKGYLRLPTPVAK
jgi:hypothetical protein